MFNITRKGIYNVPNWGRIDATKEIVTAPERLLLLLEDKGFPWIELQLTDETLKWLKSLKLEPKRLGRLIMQSNSIGQVNFLLKLTKSKTLENLAETRIKSLENS